VATPSLFGAGLALLSRVASVSSLLVPFSLCALGVEPLESFLIDLSIGASAAVFFGDPGASSFIIFAEDGVSDGGAWDEGGGDAGSRTRGPDGLQNGWIDLNPGFFEQLSCSRPAERAITILFDVSIGRFDAAADQAEVRPIPWS